MKIKDQFGDRIKQLRLRSGMSQDDVANIINKQYGREVLNKSLLSRYENNIHKPKGFTVVQDLADLFGVSTNYLMCRSDDALHHSGARESRMIPVLGDIACGVPILAQEDIESYEQVDVEDKADFALRAKGDSMIGARILDGDTVFIRQQPDVESGEIAAVIVDNEEATLKRVHKVNGTIILRSENPAHGDQVFSRKDTKRLRILGKAIYFKTEVR